MTKWMWVMLILLSPAVFAQDGWKLETASAQWLPRSKHSAEAFNGKLWLLNGVGGSTYPTDIWSSTDGVFWSEEVEPFPWGSQRYNASTVVFNGRLWLLGGRGTLYFNDVWSSPDGVNWTEETPSAPWTGRYHHSAAVFDGRIWLTGGINYSLGLVFNDLWSSADGINWTQEPNTPWPGRTALAMEEFNGRLWVLGTTDTFDPTSDVWSSADGVSWTQETSSAPWAPRVSHASAVYNGRLWVFGGSSVVNMVPKGFSDVWSSADGVNWVQETQAAEWGLRNLTSWGEPIGRASMAVTVFDGRIWLIGGADGSVTNDVWSYGLHVRPDVLPDGVVGEPYSAALEAREGDGPFVWVLTGGSLPPGLALDTSTTAATLPIAGTPSQVGTFNFTIHLTDDNSYTNEQQISIQINPRPPLQSESSDSSGCALQHVPIPAWLLLPAAMLALRRRRP